MKGMITKRLAFYFILSSLFFLFLNTLCKYRQTQQNSGEWTLSQAPKILCHSLFYDTRVLCMQGKTTTTNYCNCGARSIGVRGGGGDGDDDDVCSWFWVFRFDTYLPGLVR